MKNYSEISNRYMKENKKRTIFTILGITLATVLIFAVGTFILSFRDSLIDNARSDADYEFKVYDITGEQAEKIIANAEVKDSSIVEDGKKYKIKNSDKKAVLEKGNQDYYEKIQTNEIVEGRKPQKYGEVLIDQTVASILKYKVDDKVNLVSDDGNEETVTVVGIAKSGMYVTDMEYIFQTYLDGIDKSNNYSVYVNLKCEKGKQDVIKKILSDNGLSNENKQDNYQLLYLTGNGGNENTSTGLEGMAIFVIGVVMVCTIAVIYNSFNISVIERIKYYGILKAIGATPKQIRRIIFKEGFLMALISIPIGCLVGFLGLKYGMKIFIGDKFGIIIDDFKVGFYPEIVLATIGLIFITVLLSIIMPARKAKKVSAVDAMRNANEIKIGKIKKRRSGIVQKIFGIEGSIAYKNIRRTPFRFIVTVLALTISIILFNVFYGFIDFAKQSINQMYIHVSYDSILNKNGEDGFTQEEIDKFESKIKAVEKKKYYENYEQIAIPTKNINRDFEDETKTQVEGLKIEGTDYSEVGDFKLEVTEENGIKDTERFIKDGKLDFNELNDNGVVLIDYKRITNSDGDKELIRATNFKVGDTIKIPKVTTSKDKGITPEQYKQAIQNGEYYEVKVTAIVEKDPINGDYIPNSTEVMMTKDAYQKVTGKTFTPNQMTFVFDENNDEARKNAIKYFEDNNDSRYMYMDKGNQLDQIEDLYSQIEFFVYSFIIIITIISIVNIFNTISTNLLLRKKEFSTMKAIGMTEKQLRKTVLLEGTLYGVFAAIIGGILSVVLLLWLVKLGGGFVDLEYKFGTIPFVLSIVAAILVTYVSTAVPLKKLKKLSIVEGISANE